MPRSVMHKNIFTRLPKEFLITINDDNFICLILLFSRKRRFLAAIEPVIYRLMDTSLWNLRDQALKA